MAVAPKTLAERCALVEMLVLDVDGVLTDGGIIYDDDGRQLKVFHVRDGVGLKIWHQAGKRSAFLTGRQSKVVAIRAAELGVSGVVQGAADKRVAFRELVAAAGLRPEQVCYVGDDLPDLGVFRDCGLAVTVADACAEAVADAHYVSRAAGGHGAVREIIELLLRTQGRWQSVVDSFRCANNPRD
jgi:3-deoxy-D-manno-octulosonate 8-phosphate phosphatase (KDO 8-P phosphatase)